MADDLHSRSLLLIVAEVSSLAILNVLSLINLQRLTTPYDNKPLHHCSGCERFALRYFCYAPWNWCANNQ